MDASPAHDHTRLSTENVDPSDIGTTSDHGAASRTNSYTDSPPGTSGSNHPRRISTNTRTALLSHTFARYPTRGGPVKETPEEPIVTSDAPTSGDDSSSATTRSSPG